MPRNTEEVLRRFKHVAIPELNMGQLSKVIRSEYLIDAVSWNKVKGMPYTAHELEELMTNLLVGNIDDVPVIESMDVES